VRDLAHQRATTVQGRYCPIGRVASVGFAPDGRQRDWLAGASEDGNAYAVDTATGHVQCIGGPPLLIGLLPPPIVRWTPAGDILLAHAQYIDRLRIVHGHVRSLGQNAYVTAELGVADVAASRDGRTMVVALIGEHSLREVEARLPHLRTGANLAPIRILRSLPVPAPANYHATLFWR
jgi:hypothetical protein